MESIKKTEVSDLSNFIWNVADALWGDFTHSDFDRIILPFLLLRRLECVLAPTKEDVLQAYEEDKDTGVDLELILPLESGKQFYNTSQYSLETIGSTNTKANLEQYISCFSSNVRTIFDEYNFINTINELDNAKLLYYITNKFAALDLSPETVSDRVMSNTYEQLIRDFAASVNQKAGEFMSPRDAVHLTTLLVLNADEEIFTESGVIRTIYDPTCGTGGFLFDAINEIKSRGSTAKLVPYGQELNPKTHAIALTSLLIQDFDITNIKQGNTLSDDKLSGKLFNYGVANPPFGIKWDKVKQAVVQEHESLGFAGRFGAGLPRVGDGSMLFLMHLVAKMERPENGGGRVGIILSGSPLFTGDAGSGESEIRRWLLENDYVEAILALPNDMFFNTGIGTYIWILSNKKAEERKGKVQLLNLTDTWTQMRKSEGSKRKFISREQMEEIVREYDLFENSSSKNVKVFNTTDFAYRKVAIKRPLRAKIVITEEKIQTLKDVAAFKKLKEPQQTTWLELLPTLMGTHDYEYFYELVKQKNGEEGFGKTSKANGNMFTAHFMVRDEDADPVLDNKGNVVPDTSLNDSESIPFDKDVEEYFQEEVLPHVHDAFIDYSVRDSKDGEVGIVGYEINFNRYFYEYTPPRPLADIDNDLKACEARIQALLQEVAE
ncbi:SAM-dependent DNA methyltransferase [Alteromonas portus]|uniref:site-specific DNA-methyltransferase (adenine-specific) n=1 Tax=Alteromonas portus TaxID=2565549 RepID=A0A4U0ZBJ7_9ALTE|nr:class I SAM-dependent DNA methyltransferase [Alteromonas portus]TKB01994.1 SAM-dependent DNA methyltransferase [Alteromonas portus]